MKRYALPALLGALCACSPQQVNDAGSTIASAAPKLASDAAIVAQVQVKLLQVDADSALHVAVSSHDGLVHLSGKVKSAASSRRFVQAASAVSGVKHVAANLSVDSKLPSPRGQISDFALVAAVRANILAQAGLNGVNLGVSNHAGKIELTGTVETKELRATIVHAAQHTSGVKSVDDQLKVKG